MLERKFESLESAVANIDIIASEIAKKYGIKLGQGTQGTIIDREYPSKRFSIADTYGTEHIIVIDTQIYHSVWKTEKYGNFVHSIVRDYKGDLVVGNQVNIGNGRIVSCLCAGKYTESELDKFFQANFIH